MRKHILLFPSLILILALASASAQPQRGAPENIVKELRDRLALSEEQTAAVQVVVDSFRTEINARREEFAGDRQAAMPVIMGLRDAMYDRIGQLLNDTQKEEFVKYRKEREDRLRERFRNRGRD